MQIRKTRRNRARRTLLYGVAGIGKSTFGALAEKPIFIDLEDGLADVEAEALPHVTEWSQVIDQLVWLRDNENDYRTIVLDSADALEGLIWKQVCRDHSVTSIEGVGYAKGYRYAVDYFNEILGYLDWFSNNRDIEIILLAHSAIEKFEDPSAATYSRYVPRLHKHANAVVCDWCDEILFACYETFVRELDEGFNRTRGKAESTGARVLYTCESASHVAKSRLNMPDKMKFRYSVYKKARDNSDNFGKAPPVVEESEPESVPTATDAAGANAFDF